MSVLVADPKIYEAIYSKMLSYRNRNQVDINFCSVFNRMTEEEIQQFVKTLCNLNEHSYDRKYKEKTKIGEELSKFINFSYQLSKINTYQMLKYLQMIRYNIEIKNKVLIKLDDAISEISYQIINQLPEYQIAKWAEI